METISPGLTLAAVVLLVAGVRHFFTTRAGEKIGNYLPAPFWIYFLPMCFASVHLLPHQSPIYDGITQRALPAALILMLIGTPLTDLRKLGPKASAAMAVGSVSMFLAMIIGFVAFMKWLPPDGWKAVGALLGTWIGGSANMLAVKEILQLPDTALAPLVITDTFLSYGWLALLLAGAGYQKIFDAGFPEVALAPASGTNLGSMPDRGFQKAIWTGVLLAVGFLAGEVTVRVGKILSGNWTVLSASGWTLLLASSAAVGLALTPLSRLEKRGASSVGSFLLYLVLVTIGAKATMGAALDAPAYLAYGLVAFLLHAVMFLAAGRFFKIPLFLLTTASQANIGGAVSAPIVANVYRPGTAYIGVLMAILGVLAGTYVGVLGGWICRWIARA